MPEPHKSEFTCRPALAWLAACVTSKRVSGSQEKEDNQCELLQGLLSDSSC